MEALKSEQKEGGDATPSLLSYLIQTAPLLLNCESDIIERSLNSDENQDILSRFATTVENSFLELRITEGNVILSNEMSLLSNASSKGSFALVKLQDLPLDLDRSIPSQVQVFSGLVNITDVSSSVGESNSADRLLKAIQQLTKYLVAPLAKSVRQMSEQAKPNGEAIDEEHNYILQLQKRVRDLEMTIEQCQQGSSIPSIQLSVPQKLLEASRNANPVTLKTLLEKFNATQVDALFTELQIQAFIQGSDQVREEFANEVNKTAKLWPAELLRQTRLVESPFAGTVEKEMNFWRELDQKLSETKEQLESAPILLTKLVLKRTNRVSEQLILEAEAKLDRSIKEVEVSLSFLRDFPVKELMETASLDKMAKSVTNSLSHFAKLRHSQYDFTRAVKLLEVLGSMVISRILSIVQEKNIMRCSMEDLKTLKQSFDHVLLTWKTNLTNQRTTLKDVARRRNEKLSTLKFDFDALQVRVNAIFEFREQHERLLNILSHVLSGSEGTGSFITELSEAYQIFVLTNPDVFDISGNGNALWASNIQQYEKRLETIEEKITRILDDRLGSAKSADEMFRIFALFNPLFFRPMIRNAVNSFRATLMKSVREDVKRLQEKFRLRYDDSQERITANLRDIPPLSGRIIWARQIENQLQMLMRRIQDVLGVGWEDHLEGRQLKEVCDELRSYLDTNQIYESWLQEQLRADQNKYSKIKDFLLLVENDPRGSQKILKVNFEEKQVWVHKEVKYLEWLLPTMIGAHKSIPNTIKARSAEANLRYPIALALESAMSSYNSARSKLTASNSVLLVNHLQAVRDSIKEAIGGSKRAKWIKWDSPELNDWVNQLAGKIYSLQERVDDVNEKVIAIDRHISELKSCLFDRSVMESCISSIQRIIDELPSKALSNLTPWVNQLDKQIERIIAEKLKQAIVSWSEAFESDWKETSAGHGQQRQQQQPKHTEDQYDEQLHSPNSLSKLNLKPISHDIALSNQILFVQPSLESTRKHWIDEYHKFIAMASSLPRLIAQRVQVFAESSRVQEDYSSIISLIDMSYLQRPYCTIEAKVTAAKLYAAQWLQYQALWDASVATVTDFLESDINKWQKFLEDVKIARSSVDSAVDKKAFGPIIVNHRQVQNKINLKYDSWQRESQSRFCSILIAEIRQKQAELVGTKTRLETLTLEGNTKDAIMGIEFIVRTKSSIDDLELKIQSFRSSEKLLQAQRFNFPAEWLPVSNILGTYGDMCSILERRTGAMNAQLPNLQQKIKDEDTLVAARTEKFLENWNLQKPVEGSFTATAALEALSMFNSQLIVLLEDYQRLRGAKESLKMDFISDDRLSFVSAEISDLREAWLAISPISDKLNSLFDTSMKDMNPATIRKSLEELVSQVKQVPPKVRGYAAVETVSDRLQKYLGFQPILRDLSTEALKDRHWKLILEKISVKTSFKALTVGNIWESSALSNRKPIQEILATAQGEAALEQFLKDLRDHWVSRELTLALRDSAKIIVEWDKLFSTLEDNLSSLASLKQSPYFRNIPEFQEETSSWETRLTHLRGMFDIWIEVQRKWLYLRGIFRNADIKAQLPAQYSKFKSIDNEYSSLIKRISAKPVALEVLQIDNLQRQLEREDSTMTLIQKALGDYLESQRQIFPRFYFVNNEDLIEIIGNSNEPSKVIVHMGKMFAAICGLLLNQNDESEAAGLRALAMHSKEGEVVTFSDQIDLSVGVKDWLTALQTEMVSTLSKLLDTASTELNASSIDIINWMKKFPAQVIILASQIVWTKMCEDALAPSAPNPLSNVINMLESRLQNLSLSVLNDMEPDLRRKCEQLLTEMVHQRDVAREISSKSVTSNNDFAWLYHLRFYWNSAVSDLRQKLNIRISNAQFHYGFEYLGVAERLVQTPLTDRCYLTLTQALHFRMGGNPFGPAGTGKTESVKMLGAQLGRFVLVFNCDSSFDYAAMGRIFAGLCQVGAWGCFDEFNRLEERILSAVSQQILTIQRGLLSDKTEIDLMGQSCKLAKDVGIFVTLNPGYAGRSNLPDNLKQLFRAVAMSVPDRKLIAQVMLYSQGIATAEELAGKIVLLFVMCEEQLSLQSHYDFGLRALKSVLVGAGELKRQSIFKSKAGSINDNLGEMETKVLITSACDSILPKLVAEDIPLFTNLLSAVFPGYDIPKSNDQQLIDAVLAVCEEEGFVSNDTWLEKIIQLKQVQDIRHGIMLVGPSGTGKTSTWRVLLKALSKVDKCKSDFYVIDPKSIKKDKLFGHLDPNTAEWTDGIFTKLLRKVSDTSSGRGVRRSWIIFDGDVDPEWAENLNSVLDDNKILTLPSGDRLKIPSHVRIILEVDNLRHTTLATVSRCGMVWFADFIVSLEMNFNHRFWQLAREESNLSDSIAFGSKWTDSQRRIQSKYLEALKPYFFSQHSLVEVCLKHSLNELHVMETSVDRLLDTLFSMLSRGLVLLLEKNDSSSDFPMPDDQLDAFSLKWLLFSITWSFGSSMNMNTRTSFAKVIEEHCTLRLPSSKLTFLDIFPNTDDGEWTEWVSFVPRTEIESHKVSSSDVIISTTDTIRHTEVLKCWLQSRKPLILCGPPGSGKTMTLTAVLETSSDFILAPLNFSSGTTPDLILKTFAQYCEVVDSPDGLVLQPNRQSYREHQWLVIFCDEINLPAPDSYGTQRVITFMRQLTEQGGYWNNDCKWISLRRVQFVGACNPPTDAGRVELSGRFLRHAPVLFVDYPAEASLKQIYRCFNQALLRIHPNLKGFVDPLNDAMIEVYLKNKEKFTADIAPQYIYSPRELSRWVRAMHEAMEPLDAMTSEELVRLWAHEALRLFQDRLIGTDDREWCSNTIDSIAAHHFPAVDLTACLKRPILYSQWIKRTYQSENIDVLREFVAARLKVFYEEELDVPLVIFDEVLDHVLRIDNVLRHPIGHLLLVGESGVGKTVLTRFVAWMNGLSIFQIKANSRYTIDQFDEDLRTLFRRVGIEGEKICFIFDESNVLSSAFLERMNALLASGEVPGLFEGDERVQLMAACRESFQKEGLVLDSEDELYRRFTKVIQRNLHVVFTMNPASADFANRCTTSPALFNRCVVDWFGTWSEGALSQVAFDFTQRVDSGFAQYQPPAKLPESLSLVSDILKRPAIGLNEALVAALVNIHNSANNAVIKQGKITGRQHYLSPRDFLDLIGKFIKTEEEKREALEDQQTHIRTGLQKLLETQDQVFELNQELTTKSEILRVKDIEANKKLSLMIEKQNEAEQRKATAEQLTAELQKQNEEIRVRREVVERELSEAEPALLSAKQSVQNIRKTQLDEVRALARPPNAVRLTMEMVCVMIGEANTDWTEIRKVIRKDDFIATVVNFDPLQLTAKQIKKVSDEYLSISDLNYDAVDRASKACGPLFNWAVSQIQYATILKKIKPLRDEMVAIEEQSRDLFQRHEEAITEVSALEETIKNYKMEYATAIRETEIVRAEMESVSKRVNRANALLGSLHEEKVRWQSTMESFDQQMSTLIGDCILSASFLTYAGIFDHRVRTSLTSEWTETIESLNIPFRAELDFVAYLSRPTDQLYWTECGLPNDTLAIQNAILLERYNRFPLIIDPAGQGTRFIMNKFAKQKIVQTSFLDASFLKTLASAIRFGSPLLVQDVESIDPILNPVLNREIQRTGGRSLIRLGNEDIDFSPKFMIILLTRNPFARFSPDLCSRVTTVNFTITPASLESQVLGEILRAVRPDIDKRRSDVLRLQSEQNAKLRELEQNLLNRISAVQGAILDDDTVINSLEGIKGEALQLSKEVNQTEETLEEVRKVSTSYLALASATSSVYFTLESLGEMNKLYQYSLQFFLDIIGKVLVATTQSNSAVAPAAGTAKQVYELKCALFKDLSRRVLPALLNADKVVFLVRLAQIATQDTPDSRLTDAEADFLTKGPNQVEISSALIQKYQNLLPTSSLTDLQAKNIISLAPLPAFSQLSASLSSNANDWIKFLTDPEPERVMPMDWLSNATNLPADRISLLKALIVRALRSERVMYSLEEYISSVFDGFGFNWREFCNVDLKSIVEGDSTASRPLMLCSQPGQDASAKVDSLSTTLDKPLLQVSMGSSEGFVEAEKLIAQASKTGAWVLLRNVHLCLDWLSILEKRLFGMHSHDQFRLFLTCEINEGLPTALLRRSEIIVFESSSGMKANLQRFFLNIPTKRIDRSPTERGRLYGLLAWFNAVVQERLRYAPLGWTKRYEFTDSDLLCSLDVIDQWVDEIAGSRAHVDPTQLPWKALKTLLAQSLYGGRVDQSFDQAALEAFIDSIFSAANYSSESVLVRDASGAPLLQLPDSLSRQSFETWIKALPDANPPSWIGLPTTAENQLRRQVAQKALSRLALLQGLVEESTLATSAANSNQKHLLETISRWISIFPDASKKLSSISSSLSKVNSVLARNLLREVQQSSFLIDTFLSDLDSIRSYLMGESKLTNAVRELLSSYRTGHVPLSWRRLCKGSDLTSLNGWIEDLSLRVQSLRGFETAVSSSQSFVFSLGHLFSPEAFIIAIRQMTAQENKWGLEDLELYLDIAGDILTSGMSQDVTVNGLVVQGAQWKDSKLCFSDDLRHLLPPSKLKWRPKNQSISTESLVSLPMYTSESRKIFVAQMLVSVSNASAGLWAQRGVAIILQPPLN